MAITPNPAFDVNFTISGDRTRQAISKYMSSKTEIYEYLNQLKDGIDGLEGQVESDAWAFRVNGEEI
jgi:transposase